jgi:aspartate/methionine/tyrosine aminotransferase
VQSIFVDFDDVDQFSPEAVSKYEKTLNEAQEKGIRVRALMLCHPHNPLGQCYPRETLIAIMQLCQKYEIHLLADEIYAMSVYSIPDAEADANAIKFESILSIESDQYIDSNKYLHHLYGMSKDTAASGIRIGALYTRNDELLRALSAVSPFHWSGSANERVAIQMLEDEKWMDEFLSRSRERLAARNQLVRQILDDEGIEYRRGANAGFFIWVDFRPFLSAPMNAKVEDRWRAEDELLGKLLGKKVYITNGKEMAAEEPGWFRVIYSQDERVIREGLRR